MPFFLALVTACGTSPYRDGGAPITQAGVWKLPNAIPRVEPRSKYGNPKYYDVLGKRYHVKQSSAGFTQRGIASWYGSKFHGRPTANGERYNMYGMSAAHPTLPLPTYIRVTNLENGRSVVVRVNDRGPFVGNRILDLSYAAAAKLNMLKKGTALVGIEAVDSSNPNVITAGRGGATYQTGPGRSDNANRVARITGSVGLGTSRRPRLYLQVGAFGDHSNARRLQNTLSRSIASNVRVVAGSRNQRALYRVWVGPLQGPEQIEHLDRYVRRFGVGKTLVIAD